VDDRHRVDVCVVTEQEKERRRQLKKQLPKELAHGTRVEEWPETKGVAERTAYRWAADPEIQAKAQAIRLRAFDRAVGQMTSRLDWATDRIPRHGAPPRRTTPNQRLGSPAIVSIRS
jgi:hypothetical protein